MALATIVLTANGEQLALECKIGGLAFKYVTLLQALKFGTNARSMVCYKRDYLVLCYHPHHHYVHSL